MKIIRACALLMVCLTACLDASPKPELTASDDVRLAHIDVRAMADGLAPGSKLKLSLPDSGDTELVVRTVQHLVPGVTSFAGHLAGDEDSDFTLSIEGSELVGAIHQGTQAWVVEPHAISGQHTIRVLDRTKLSQHEPPMPSSIQRDTVGPRTDGPGVMSAAAGTGDVRVLFLYATDVNNPSSQAANIVLAFNESLRLSDVSDNNKITSAGVQAVSSNFPGMTRPQVRAAMNARSAPFTNLNAAMDAAAADIAFLLISEDPTILSDSGGGWGRVGGIANIFDPANPFALSTQTYALGDRTALHEIGHVFGGRHENDGTSIARPVVAVDDTWMTVMGGYIECPFNGLMATCVRLNRWSNPDQTYLGIPLGVPGQRDMESHLESSMPIVSGWRGEPGPAAITSPANGSTLPGATVTFTWSAGVGASQYYLYVGNTAGGSDLYAASQGLATSATVSGLPTDGRMIYVRLWSYINNSWQWADYSYRAATSTGIPAIITSPANGSTLTGTSVTFTWNTGSGVAQYYLYVGNSVGGADIYNASQGLATSATVSNLPSDGRAVYVRLWSLINGSWQFRDYNYTAFRISVPAVITSPAAGSTLGASATFTWGGGVNVSQYYLYVGSSNGGADLYSASQGLATSVTVSNLPTDGRTLFVRLWSLINGGWQYRDYTYTASSSCSPLAGSHGQIWMPIGADTLYQYHDGWCTVGHGIAPGCYFGTYFHYQNLQSSYCTSVGSNGTCYDNDAWWYATCDSLVDCVYNCAGQCIKTDC